ncbi:MAG: hypothetical protein ACRC6R_01745 [Bacteroidales bacterium]
MNKQEELYLYDNEESLRFIRNYLPKEISVKYSDDDIYYVIDLLYKYKGICIQEEDYNEQINLELDEKQLTEFVIANSEENKKVNFVDSEIIHIIRGELMYDQSIGLTCD